MTEEAYRSKQYVAEPTGEQFHNCHDRVRLIMGPFSSGKSTICIWELVLRAQDQEPGPDGVRRSRWAIVRQTYPELRSTTIKSWQEWFGQDICPISFGSPIEAHMKYMLPDKTWVDAEFIFLALNIEKDAKKLLSLQLTGAWINEAREVSRTHFDGLTGRIGRYPPDKDGGPSWSGIIMDTNPPHNRHYLYNLFEIERPVGFRLFKQPPALLYRHGVLVPNTGDIEPGVPAAENISHIKEGFGYYVHLAAGKSREFIKVYVLGDYGSVFSGMPVWQEYADHIHCSAQDLDVYRGLPLILGFDFGLTPAAAFVQVSPTGQIRVIDEVVTDGMGIRRMAQEHLKPKLAREYGGMQLITYGDPAGVQRGQTDEKSCFDILRSEGFDPKPAPTNAFPARRDVVARALQRTIAGDPGFILSPKCRTIREGMQGGYRFEARIVGGTETYTEHPEKTFQSHVCEGLEYALLGIEPSSATNLWGDNAGGMRGNVRTKARQVVAADMGGYT